MARVTAEQQIRTAAAENGKTVEKVKREDGRTAYRVGGGSVRTPGDTLDSLVPGGKETAARDRR